MKIDDVLTELSYDSSVELERKLDQMFRNLGLDIEFTQHFLNRIIDSGDEGRRDSDHNSHARDADVTPEEIEAAFAEMKKKYGRELWNARKNPKEFTAVLKDISSSLNIPFSIDYDSVGKKLHQLNAITLMRKRNFHTKGGDKVLQVRS